MRRLKRINSSYVDVLIIDANGSDFISQCIPEKYSSRILGTRGVFPFVLSISFLLILTKMVMKFGFTPMALISSIVQSLKPKVVITFIDNISIMGELSELFPRRLVVSVQNGVRFEGDWRKNYKLPVYFGFGEYEHELIKEIGVNVGEYKSVGSLKMGVFLSSYLGHINKSISNKKICFISQYRHNMLGSEDQPWYGKFFGYSKDLFVDIVKWSKANNYKLSVAMVSEQSDANFDNEMKYFKDSVDCSDVHFSPNIREELSSYKVCIDAELLVTMDSTLSFEMFGHGKKVLFCGAMNDSFSNIRGSVGLFEKMPDFVILKESESGKKSLSGKLLNLLTMNNEEYYVATKSARSFYMKTRERPPHELISSYISNFMKNMPFGTHKEVVSLDALHTIIHHASDVKNTEYLEYYLENSRNFNINYVHSDYKFDNKLRMTLDYKEDLDFFNTIFRHFNKIDPNFTLKDVLKWLEKNNSIVKINSHKTQKTPINLGLDVTLDI